MATETIFTLEGRDNILLCLLKNRYNLESDIIYDEINGSFNTCISSLAKMSIKYQDLKHSLIPSTNRNEIAFVFDRNTIEVPLYDIDVFSKLIPLFDKQSCNSVLCGDFIGDQKLKEKLKLAFLKHIKSVRQIDYVDHYQFFIVYINNLSDKMVTTIKDGLKLYNSYVGYFDLTYSSFLKTYLSFILNPKFIKCKTTIINGNAEEQDDVEDLNDYSESFEENGFKCKSIQSIYYDLFLSYKIERKVYDGFAEDTSFSINAISRNVFDISEFSLLVEKEKFAHLLKAKADNLERAGITNLTIEEVESLIKNEISNNYIYNLTFLKEHSTIKFNIIIETIRTDSNKSMKLIVALEYKPTDKTLRLITMF